MQKREVHVHGAELSTQKTDTIPSDEDSDRINTGVLLATTADLDAVCWEATAKKRATMRDMFLVASVVQLSAEPRAPQRFKEWSRWSMMQDFVIRSKMALSAI